jgi:hypothetical protein
MPTTILKAFVVALWLWMKIITFLSQSKEKGLHLSMQPLELVGSGERI